MKLTVKHLKIISLVLGIVLLIFAGWSIFTTVGYNKKKADFLVDKQKREDRIQKLEIEREKAKTEAELSAKAAKVAATERDEVKAELEREREKHMIVVEEVERMEPDELVIVTQTLLEMGLNDIYRNPEGVQFSLAATKRLTIKLTYLDFYLDVEKPKLIESDKKAKEEAVYWHEAYATLSEGALAKAEETIEELTDQVAEDKKEIERAEKQIKRASLQATVKTVVVIGGVAVLVKWVILPLFGGK